MSENHGDSPVRIRVPPLKKVLQRGKKKELPGSPLGALAAMRQQQTSGLSIEGSR
jgi:hypothetical protein